MLKQSILTKMEQEVINRRLNNEKLSKQDSYYLSVSIRPKLRQMEELSKKNLLKRIDYMPKIASIERKIVNLVRENLQEVDSIILYGSVVQTNYHDYNDIDIMIVTREKIEPESSKYKKINELEEILKKNKIIADVEIISKKNLLESYKNSPTLIYQLKDHKIIYGKIKIPYEIELYNIDLLMKLDWSYVDDTKNGNEIYRALRNTLLVRLLLHNIVDNSELKTTLHNILGKESIERLKNNQSTHAERKIALKYLKLLIEDTRQQIKGGLWEKIRP